MNTKKFNGFSNRATEIVATWINHDRSLYEQLNTTVARLQAEGYDLPEEILVDELKALIGNNPLGSHKSCASDLLAYALSEVNFQEVARDFLAE